MNSFHDDVLVVVVLFVFVVVALGGGEGISIATPLSSILVSMTDENKKDHLNTQPS